MKSRNLIKLSHGRANVRTLISANASTIIPYLKKYQRSFQKLAYSSSLLRLVLTKGRTSNYERVRTVFYECSLLSKEFFRFRYGKRSAEILLLYPRRLQEHPRNLARATRFSELSSRILVLYISIRKCFAREKKKEGREKTEAKGKEKAIAKRKKRRKRRRRNT